MDCPVCGTGNILGIKYCIRCGGVLENPHEVNYNNNNSMVSADLFSGEDETDFSSSEKITVADIFEDDFQSDMNSISRNSGIDVDLSRDEKTTVANIFEEDDYENTDMNFGRENNQSYSVSRNEPQISQPYASANPYVSQMYGGQSVTSMPAPQIIGYYPDGTPIYGQPPIIYQQSQPISQYVSQPISQPISQYVSQPVSQPISQYVSQPVSQPISQYVSQPLESVRTNENKAENEKFRQFIDEGKDGETAEKSEDDFFGKSADRGDVIVSKLDSIDMKRREGRSKDYMEDTPLVDADRLVKNDASKFNKMYMRRTEQVNADNLEEKKSAEPNRIMKTTNNVDAERLNTKMKFRSRIRMGDAENEQIDEFNTQEKKRRKIFMAEADHAVEAMPKKKKYVDEIDAIELPEYMKARKTVKKDTPEIPEL